MWTLCWSWSMKISWPANRLFPLSKARSCKLQFCDKSEVFRITWNCEICQSNMAAVVSSFYHEINLLLFGTLHWNFWHRSKILCIQSSFIQIAIVSNIVTLIRIKLVKFYHENKCFIWSDDMWSLRYGFDNYVSVSMNWSATETLIILVFCRITRWFQMCLNISVKCEFLWLI